MIDLLKVIRMFIIINNIMIDSYIDLLKVMQLFIITIL